MASYLGCPGPTLLLHLLRMGGEYLLASVSVPVLGQGGQVAPSTARCLLVAQAGSTVRLTPRLASSVALPLATRAALAGLAESGDSAVPSPQVTLWLSK